MTARQSKVPIADDSNTVHQLIRDSLPNDYSANIVHAFDGVEGLQALDHGVDLAFIDVHMPTMGGMDAFWQARIAGNKTFVTLISGEYDAPREREAIKLGAAAIMHKPFFPTEIDAVLHRIFGLQSPKLATDGYVRDFGIKIHGRTIAVEHAETGHLYEYVWFRDPPYLRLPLVRENEAATIPVAELMANAKKAAMLELENASLLHASNVS